MAEVWFTKKGTKARTPGGSYHYALEELVEKLRLKATDYCSQAPPEFESPNVPLDSVREAEHVVVHVDDSEAKKHAGWRAGYYCPPIDVEEAIERLGL